MTLIHLEASFSSVDNIDEIHKDSIILLSSFHHPAVSVSGFLIVLSLELKNAFLSDRRSLYPRLLRFLLFSVFISGVSPTCPKCHQVGLQAPSKTAL